MTALERLTHETALKYWKRLTWIVREKNKAMPDGSRIRLASPVTAGRSTVANSWLQRFLAAVDADPDTYKVDIIALHWYGQNFTNQAAVQGNLLAYVDAVRDDRTLRGGNLQREVWITEFGLMQPGPPKTYPSPEFMADFVAGSVPKLEQRAFVWAQNAPCER